MKDPLKLALFDFDGTITTRDSLLHFLLTTHGLFTVCWGAIKLLPLLIKHFLKLENEQITKTAVLIHFFSAMRKEQFESICQNYSKYQLFKIVRPSALSCIKKHLQDGHRVIVVSASLDSYLRPWCESLELELLATLPAYDERDYFSGFAGANCKGPEKVKRIQQHLDLSDYTYIYAYGDSSGDTDMLKLANEAHYKPFR